ncbi:hypothetical protein PN36_21490 [Candidatus Thiomargarita nelsonii]|uniref:Capsule assembly Wzi family protein n=1 Tax=Candidatus Thiomargarita nelsonii TaxID=1003181 RepID=A0A4E0QMM0_9GAMM|nr:hypothetical protein PN36_21490 [Candidatus Thiomargarita nelsonii]
MKFRLLILIFLVSLKHTGTFADESAFLIPPHLIDKKKLSSGASGLVLNDTPINHTTDWLFSANALFGSDRNSTYIPNALYTLNSEVEQSVSRDNIFSSEQRGRYLQLRGVIVDYDVTFKSFAPQTMLGMTMQMTFTGSCAVVGKTDTDKQCTYLPALSIDRDKIDPYYFVPTSIKQLGMLGDDISPETLAILQQPGFQNEGANGEYVGLDLYFPNAGMHAGNSQSKETRVERRENTEIAPVLSYSDVRQVLKTNANKAVYGRTIRGVGVVWKDNQAGHGALWSALSYFLPDMELELAGTTNPSTTRVNVNLLRAANNSRMPLNSWTLYQVGMGRAAHPQPEKPIPGVWFNNIWLGLSPVVKRRLVTTAYYVATGPETLIAATGGEGGSGEGMSFVASYSNGVVVNSEVLDDFYIQNYMTFSNRDVDAITIQKLNEEVTYYPHLSLTGNFTGNNFLWRYYSGVIAAPKVKGYLGTDFRHAWGKWYYLLSGIAYYHPDQDYFSQVQATVSRPVSLTKLLNTKLFTRWRYAFEQTPESILDEPLDNYALLGINLATKSASVDVYRYFKWLPEALNGNAWGLDARYSIKKYATVRTFLHPAENQKSYGLSFEYQTGKSANSLTLIGSWQHNEFEYGFDPFDHLMSSDQDVFSLGFRIGSP